MAVGSGGWEHLRAVTPAADGRCGGLMSTPTPSLPVTSLPACGSYSSLIEPLEAHGEHGWRLLPCLVTPGLP